MGEIFREMKLSDIDIYSNDIGDEFHDIFASGYLIPLERKQLSTPARNPKVMNFK